MEKQTVKRGMRVTCNGYHGTIIRTRDCPGSAWLGNMVEIRLAGGVICTAEYLPVQAAR